LNLHQCGYPPWGNGLARPVPSPFREAITFGGERMTDRVIVELQDVTDKATATEALKGHGCQIEDKGDTLVVSVPDSRDAEEEVTEALNDVGVSAYVYLAEDL